MRASIQNSIHPIGSFFNGIARSAKKLGDSIATFVRYLMSFRWIVDLARKIQDTGAIVAESAFTLSIMYVIVYTFGHLLIAWIPDSVILVVNQVVMIVFTILPELVMIAIIISTFDHFAMARSTKNGSSWAWFIAYALLTILFVSMTLFLLYSLKDGFKPDVSQAKGAVFVLRCFSGLLFTVVQRLWDGKGKHTYTAQFKRLQSSIEASQSALLESGTRCSTQAIALSEMSEKIALLQHDLDESRVALASKKMSRKSATPSDAQSDINVAPSATQSATPSAAYNAPIQISLKRDTLKNNLRDAALTGERINLKSVAAQSSVSYAFARKHAQALMDEIKQTVNS